MRYDCNKQINAYLAVYGSDHEETSKGKGQL